VPEFLRVTIAEAQDIFGLYPDGASEAFARVHLSGGLSDARAAAAAVQGSASTVAGEHHSASSSAAEHSKKKDKEKEEMVRRFTL
jgi:hypothetical protein